MAASRCAGYPVTVGSYTGWNDGERDDLSVTAHGAWLATGTGAALLAEEVRCVADALESVFGDHFLQIGQWGPPDLFRRFARTRRTAVLGAHAAAGVDCVTAFDDLAIASDSVDAVLLPHVLETTHDPHGLLREVDRVLRPDGHVILLGFNALGWWGLRHQLSRRSFPAGLQRMMSERRLRDWLPLLSYSVQPASFYLFQAPFLRAAAGDTGMGEPAAAGAGRARQDRGRRMVHAITRAKIFASCYMLVARKDVLTVTPIRPAFRRRTRLVGGLVNPTTRNAA